MRARVADAGRTCVAPRRALRTSPISPGSPDGYSGGSAALTMWYMMAYGCALSPSSLDHGGRPVSISMQTQPTLQTSALRP